MSDQPLMQFDSHVAGKNAQVRVYPDRVEWGKGSWLGTGAKAALGVATLGTSLIATGVRGRKDEDMILMRSISSVTSKKSGLTKHEVNVITSGGAISFRCTGREADDFRGLLLRLVAEGGQPQAPAPAAPVAPVQAAPDTMAQLQQLGELRAAGILSDAEFEAKKAELLARL